jgi:O-antigen/teichoic acid export membrane protein
MKLFSAWVFSGVSILSGIVLLPLILTKFNSQEINVWFLYFTLVGLSELVVLGFNSTFVRFIAYTMSDIHYRDFCNIKHNKKTERIVSRTDQLSDIYTINIYIFFLIGLVYLIIMYVLGNLFLQKPISELSDTSIGWYSWYSIMFANFIRISTYTFSIFLQGMNKMPLFYNIQTVSKILYILLALIILTIIPSLLVLSIVMSFSIILSAILFYLYFKRLNCNVKLTAFNKQIFSIIWDSAWKSGITKILAPIIQHISGLLFAQVSSAGDSASYLLTQRIFNILQSLSTVTFSTYTPQLASMRSMGKFVDLRILIRKLSFIGFGILLVGYIFLLLLGDFILEIIESNTPLASFSVLSLFGFAYLFNRVGGFRLDLANQANQVIEHKATLIYSIVYFGILLYFKDDLTMRIFPLSMIIAQMISFIYVARISYPLYNTRFWRFEIKTTIPIICIMILVNAIYYLNYNL